jgi:hypothetical protein
MDLRKKLKRKHSYSGQTADIEFQGRVEIKHRLTSRAPLRDNPGIFEASSLSGNFFE